MFISKNVTDYDGIAQKVYAGLNQFKCKKAIKPKKLLSNCRNPCL